VGADPPSGVMRAPGLFRTAARFRDAQAAYVWSVKLPLAFAASTCLALVGF
jgi:hypothetical protein